MTHTNLTPVFRPHYPYARIACLTFVALLSHAVDTSAEVVDLREGVRTYMYGGGFGGGSQVGDFYGWAMAFGDVDGDGYTDFLSSSANSEGPNDENIEHENDVYLIFGGPRAEFDSVYAVDVPGGADIVFYKGGFAMACDDLDGDGYDDVVLAEVPNSNDPLEGGVYIVFGAPREELLSIYNFNRSHPNYTPADMRIIGNRTLGGAQINIQNFAFDYVAYALVTADINDDGFADIIVGDRQTCDDPEGCLDGAVYVVFGRPRDQFPPMIDTDYGSALPHPDVIIHGDEQEGYPIALAIGDFDGDGVDDLIASTQRGWGEDNLEPSLGELHGWWGKRVWREDYDTQIEQFDFSLQGVSGYRLGYRIAAGNLDGDNRDDIIAGNWNGYRNADYGDLSNMGEYRVIFGRPRSVWPRWGTAVEMTDVLIVGAETGDVYNSGGPSAWGICFSLAIGNRNKDRYDDLMIGASRVRRPDDGTRPGAGYLLYGRPRSDWEPFIDLRDGYDMVVHGVDYTGSPGIQSDRAGYVVGMGDIDGNGMDEMFIGAPFADGPNNSIPDCGEVYVVFDDGDGGPTATDASRTPSARAVLLPNYPNPFSGVTAIGFSAPQGATVSLTVYDARGREVAQPLAPRFMQGTEAHVEWRAIGANGEQLPVGIYFVKLRAGHESHARKVVLVR